MTMRIGRAVAVSAVLLLFLSLHFPALGDEAAPVPTEAVSTQTDMSSVPENADAAAPDAAVQEEAQAPEEPAAEEVPAKLEPTVVVQEEGDHRILIMGRVVFEGKGLAGVRLGGLPVSMVTDEKGQYVAEVPPTWSGTITPQLWTYAFTPASVTYADVRASQARDFESKRQVCTISGSVTVEGEARADIVISGLPGVVRTGPDGAFAVGVPAGWSGMLMPQAQGLAFTPVAVSLVNLTSDYTQTYDGHGLGGPEE